MGIVYADELQQLLIVKSVIYFYGSAATPELANKIAADIANCWNVPEVFIWIKNKNLKVNFKIEGHVNTVLSPNDIWYNSNPVNNYFRVEEFSTPDISFVDDIGSNTGYFKLANVLHTPTTAAHEYGHTIGLEHPPVLDIRGQGEPGIMYPRGTVVDAEFQYNPLANAGDGPMGGTMDASKRKVTAADVLNLKLHKLDFKNGAAVLGKFTSMYHSKHVDNS